MPGAFKILHKIAIYGLSADWRNNYFTGLLFFPVRSPDYYCILFQRPEENGIQIPVMSILSIIEAYSARFQWFRPTKVLTWLLSED